MCFLMIELLGFLAGATNLVSSLPQLISNLRKPSCAAQQSAARNACQAAGNGMWLVYGLTVGSIAMSIFSTLGCVMASLLLVQVRRARRAA